MPLVEEAPGPETSTRRTRWGGIAIVPLLVLLLVSGWLGSLAFSEDGLLIGNALIVARVGPAATVGSGAPQGFSSQSLSERDLTMGERKYTGPFMSYEVLFNLGSYGAWAGWADLSNSRRRTSP